MRQHRTYEQGDQHGILTVVCEIGKDRRGRRLVKCVCDCGNEVIVRGDGLWNGNNVSCGCLLKKHKEEFRKAPTTHGMSGTRIHRIWKGMHYRCKAKTSAGKDYAKRGINVCKEWGSFDPFYTWAMQHGYSDGLTIDRIDVNGPYSPDNCRWVSIKEQQRNKRNTIYITVGGETVNLKEYCERNGLTYITVYYRIFKLGWTVEEAVGAAERKNKLMKHGR